MFNPVILVCAATISMADCSVDNAKQVIDVGTASSTSDACAVQLRVETKYPGVELRAAIRRKDTIKPACLEE